jgi:Stress responsive A/B Barrel Domain
MIQHTVAFTLKHPAGSPEEAAFLVAADILSTIHGVQAFTKSRQVSVKNAFHFNFSMLFADQAAYDAYNVHPDHVAFVQGRWIPEVAEFLEADFVDLVL